MRRIHLLCTLVALLCSTVAVADPRLDVDTEAAQRHYLAGRALYGAGNYPAACSEFTTARALVALPALDYNLAKCEERLEHWRNALALYQRYVATAVPSEVTAEVQSRIELLSTRVAELEAQRTRRGVRIAAITLAATTVALAGAGTGAYLSEWSAYRDRENSCDHMCTKMQIAGLTTRVDRAEHIGEALWGVGGAALVVDVALWIVEARRQRAEHGVP